LRRSLGAVGTSCGDWDRSPIGVASSWKENNPETFFLARPALAAKEEVYTLGGYPQKVGTICD
jgi:dihydroxyacid dehydratase/phosphogluconate dehydratase